MPRIHPHRLGQAINVARKGREYGPHSKSFVVAKTSNRYPCPTCGAIKYEPCYNETVRKPSQTSCSLDTGGSYKVYMKKLHKERTGDVPDAPSNSGEGGNSPGSPVDPGPDGRCPDGGPHRPNPDLIF